MFGNIATVRGQTLAESLHGFTPGAVMNLLYGKERVMSGDVLSQRGRFCVEKVRLSMRFMDAVHAITSLQSQQIDALIAGDKDFGRFDEELGEAVERKDEAKYALLRHIETHKCVD